LLNRPAVYRVFYYHWRNMSQEQQNKLYVGNLNYDATEGDVRDLFAQHGAVAEVKIVMDRLTGRSRGFAFVRYDENEAAARAKEALHSQPFQGKNLVIDFARAETRDRPAGDRRPGGFGGGPRKEWGDRGGERREFRGGDRGERRERYSR
jgi:cold-inducible RNA-binding protein